MTLDETLRRRARQEDCPIPGGLEQRLDELVASLPETGRRRAFSLRRGLVLAAALCAALAVSAVALSPGLQQALSAALGGFAHYSQTVEGMSARDHGIEIRVVSALWDGNAAQIYFEVQDMSGDRLDSDTTLDVWLDPPQGDWAALSYSFSRCLGYDAENGTGLYRLHMTGDGAPVEQLTVNLGFDTVQPGEKVLEAPFPLEGLSTQTLESLRLPGGETVLRPGQTPAALEGAEGLTLSSCGFAEDGKLHLLFQTDLEPVDWEESWLSVYAHSRQLLDAVERGGTTTDCTREQRYNGAGGELTKVSFTWEGAAYYDICYEIYPEDAQDVSFDVVYGRLLTQEGIEGAWEFAIPLEKLPTLTISLEGTGTVINSVAAREAHLTTLGCTLESDPNGTGSTLGYPLAVFLADGTTVLAGSPDSTLHQGDYAVNHWSFPDPVEVEQVVGMSLGQWYIPLENGTAGAGYWLEQAPQ